MQRERLHVSDAAPSHHIVRTGKMMERGSGPDAVSPGTVLIADGGFTCMRPGAKIVRRGPHGLYVRCGCGRHYLDGQLDDDGRLIGLRVAE